MANEHPSRRIIEIAARRLDDMTLDPEIRSCLAFILNAAPDRHPRDATPPGRNPLLDMYWSTPPAPNALATFLRRG
jgi:hypothetical protein